MSRSNSIVKQASILALAGILVRIIGLLYRSPLTAMILDEGNGYYSTAYNIYALVLLISSYSIPTAISKLISEKIALKEYKNVKRILKCVFIYVCAIAGSAAILLFILAPFIVDVNAVPALRVLCPTIFLSGLLGVFRGYFQAHKTTIYTSVSQIIEQIFNAVVALLAAYIFIQPYLGVDATKVGSYGAAGSALGTGAGVLVGLIYMIFMYLKKKNTFVEEKDEEASERVDSYQEIFRMIMHIIAPIILATCVYNLVTTIDMYIFYFAQSFHHIDKITYISNYGVYAGKYIVLQNVPVALASAMSTASIPSISSAWALGNVKEAKAHITSGLSVTMLILIPAAVGMAVLSYPIMGVLFPQKATIMTATLLLALGSPAIIFYGLSTLTNGILLGIFSAISSVIPYVGPIVANLLGIVTSITMGATKLIILFVLIFIQSNVVPYVIQPKIYSSKIDLSIMWVLFGILTGSTLFGAWGMIIAMPILVTIKISYRVYRQHNPQPKNA